MALFTLVFQCFTCFVLPETQLEIGYSHRTIKPKPRIHLVVKSTPPQNHRKCQAIKPQKSFLLVVFFPPFSARPSLNSLHEVTSATIASPRLTRAWLIVSPRGFLLVTAQWTTRNFHSCNAGLWQSRSPPRAGPLRQPGPCSHICVALRCHRALGSFPQREGMFSMRPLEMLLA